jgi:DNA helicase IV
VLDFASKLLPDAAPGVIPTSSIRAGRTDPTVLLVEAGELERSALTEARALSKTYALTAVILPEDMVEAMARLVRHQDDVGILERDAMSRPVTLVSAASAKGLEFDAVVVVEPAAIAGSDSRGLRLLYVAMTRPIQHLSVVHALPLPRALTD